MWVKLPKDILRLAARRDGAPGEIRTPDPLVRSQMLYPAELRAQRVTASGVLIIAETSWLMKADHPIEIAENSRCRRHTVLIYSDYLRSALNISFSRFQQTSGMNHAFPDGRKSFSTLAIPTQLFSTSGLVFQPFRIGKSGATIRPDEVARNGAPLKINFGQRFSWTPLAFSLLLTLHFHLADGSPPQTAGRQLNSSALKLSRSNLSHITPIAGFATPGRAFPGCPFRLAAASPR